MSGLSAEQSRHKTPDRQEPAGAMIEKEFPRLSVAVVELRATEHGEVDIKKPHLENRGAVGELVQEA